MFSSCFSGFFEEAYDESQSRMEMAATLLSMAISKKAQIHDSLWKTPKQHTLRQVTSSLLLFTFVKAMGNAEELSFEQQEKAL